MARGLSIDKLIYLFFYSPFTLPTYERIPFASSEPENVMHTATSLLISLLAFLSFGFNSHAGAVFPRQASSASPSTYNTRFPSVTWDNDQWRVTTTALDQGHYQSRQSVANGYFGMLELPDAI
ncbi:MAG: hypothetical protein Q9195_004014 [Heterodermia aff. obscurata]